MEFLRGPIRNGVHSLVGRPSGRRARRGPGLFPQDAVCRKVHGDFSCMMVGGVAALLTQMLHPAALAGVWDHSDFRTDATGRLRRTAQFISATTFGSMDEAENAIARVRAIHDRVRGTLPDGTPYCANDPDLVAWVHVAGAICFLRAYIRYRGRPLSESDQDRYFAETAEIARRLGAADVPTSRAAVSAYLDAVRPKLAADGRTAEVRRALMRPPGRLPLAPLHALVMSAGVDLLPDWAAEMHGFGLPDGVRPALRLGTAGIGSVVRWALR